MIRWLQGLWYAQCRKTDMQILWPICVEQACDLDHAKAAFAVHAFNDPAWMFLGRDAVRQIIDRMEG
jgi:hypothetical protein